MYNYIYIYIYIYLYISVYINIYIYIYIYVYMYVLYILYTYMKKDGTAGLLQWFSLEEEEDTSSDSFGEI